MHQARPRASPETRRLQKRPPPSARGSRPMRHPIRRPPSTSLPSANPGRQPRVTPTSFRVTLRLAARDSHLYSIKNRHRPASSPTCGNPSHRRFIWRHRFLPTATDALSSRSTRAASQPILSEPWPHAAKFAFGLARDPALLATHWALNITICSERPGAAGYRSLADCGLCVPIAGQLRRTPCHPSQPALRTTNQRALVLLPSSRSVLARKPAFLDSQWALICTIERTAGAGDIVGDRLCFRVGGRRRAYQPFPSTGNSEKPEGCKL